MPQYNYTAVEEKTGREVKGNIEAATEAMAAAELRKEGLFATKIKEASPPDAAPPATAVRHSIPPMAAYGGSMPNAGGFSHSLPSHAKAMLCNVPHSQNADFSAPAAEMFPETHPLRPRGF